MNTLGGALLTVCLALPSAALQEKQPETPPPLPQTEGKTLADEKMVVAEKVRGRVAVLVITFSRKAGEAAAPWTRRLTAEPQAPELAVFQVAHLQEVPRIFRGLITAMIKRGTPRQMHTTFVVLVTEEDLWKKFVDFKDSGVPYLVLVNGTGQTIWRGQGAIDEERYATLRDAIKKASIQGERRN